MPSKKRYTSRFPPARIKKIMQTDEDVGKVAAPVPLIISRALELFLEQILTQTNDIVAAKSAKTLNTTHIKAAVIRETKFDFLKDLVSDIEDICLEEPSGSPADEKVTKKKRKRRSKGSNANYDDNPKIVVEDVNENTSVEDTDSADEHLELDEDEEEDDSLYHGRKDAMLPIAVNVEDGPSIKDNDSVASLPVPIATPMVSPSTLSSVLSESLMHSQVSGMVDVDDDYDS